MAARLSAELGAIWSLTEVCDSERQSQSAWCLFKRRDWGEAPVYHGSHNIHVRIRKLRDHPFMCPKPKSFSISLKRLRPSSAP